MARRVLIVEDDAVSRQLLKRIVEIEGHVAETASGYHEAVALIDRQPYDLILLDLTLEDGDGLNLCRHIRAQHQTPIMIITSRGATADVVTGLELGADDYVVKPFNIDVLTARIRAQLRRASETRRGEAVDQIRIRRLVIDNGLRDAIVEGLPAGLTNKEFELVLLLARNHGRAMAKEEILDHLFEGEVRSEKILAVYIRRLRQKIEADPDNPTTLHTVRGFGYRLGSSLDAG
ncbi:MAG TPA: response regulator transcription factor [Thermoanaerobaculia bacterium]|nr:response regulator transcription factor [Thermoanaerobaculia bacterium]